MPVSITRQGDIVQSLWNGSWIAALGTGAVVIGLIVWACVFHRKKRFSDQELPPQVRYNLPIEILYTMVPVIMVGVFFYFTARDQNEIGKISGAAPVKVRVDAFQWSWRFTTQYNNQTVNVVGTPASDYKQPQAPELVLPVDSKVEFDLHSPDVIHSFWVPAFLFKRDVIPGVTNNKFEVDTLSKTGVHAGRCAELCGYDHSRMLFRVKLVEKAEFEKYIADQARSAQ
ncbi:cytochrome c oxidase subunit II [Spongiactinospora sp. TRM90649]|uniref:aa3-type cytochrome oxidase subunit II n=1 Tax=Spongiactinospora sp. TRM90649 TaxID=3031114 RepID=UPI0023F8D8A0|nr:cytochrome c oxidase subunit II [Spongiactinospora sp. TRM90649]MDF5758503.1 cytochrome c oxidase subunit II [Spongiactinospora sp. TRM90649]